MASVMANSRNSRPTMSPMKSSGIKTAISETVNETMVKPICSEPRSAACNGRFAFFEIARDVLDHHDGVVHDEAGRDRERHQGQIVQAVTEQVHHAESSDDGERNGDARNDGGGEIAQEEKDHHHDQADGEHQLELNVFDRRTNGVGAICQDLISIDGRNGTAQLRQQRLDTIDHRNDVGARLPLNVDDHRRRGVHPGGLAGILGAVHDRRHVLNTNGRAILIGDDDGLVAGAGQDLVVGADGVRLPRAVEIALGLIQVGLARAPFECLPDSSRKRPARWDSREYARPASGRR